MGTPIAGKPHTSPLEGDEKVPLSPDGYATTQEIANLGGAGFAFGGWIYGDGSDGALVLSDGDLWTPGFYTDVTIEEGATVRVHPVAQMWPVFRMTGTFSILGTLDLSGADAVGKDAGETLHVLGTGVTGTQTDGTSAPSSLALGDAILLDAQGTPLGGLGGNGDPYGGGGIPPVAYPRHVGPRSGISLTDVTMVNAPIGGSSGGGDGTNYGGGGGAGGDWAIICARHVVHGENHAYNLQGGNGGDGGDDGLGDTGNGDCGGGGGGAAGYWVTISDTVDDIAAVIVGGGGLGGAGCGTGTDGQPGDDGFVVRLMNRA